MARIRPPRAADHRHGPVGVGAACRLAGAPARLCHPGRCARRVSRPLHVFGRDGADLLGSPLDPDAEANRQPPPPRHWPGTFRPRRISVRAWAHCAVRTAGAPRRYRRLRPGAFARRGAVPAPFAQALFAQAGPPRAGTGRPPPSRSRSAGSCRHAGLRQGRDGAGLPRQRARRRRRTSPDHRRGRRLARARAAARALDALAAERAACGLIRHARNRGFPASANDGIAAAAGRDVILLNSDTLVPPGWLERLRDAGRAAPRHRHRDPAVERRQHPELSGPGGQQSRAGPRRDDPAGRRRPPRQQRERRRYPGRRRLLPVSAARLHRRRGPLPRRNLRPGLRRGKRLLPARPASRLAPRRGAGAVRRPSRRRQSSARPAAICRCATRPC